ncbi:MAG: hypothetical protein GKS07_09300 [Nitrosopumilus sp.]|nr:MAG: hypothetical protein GKS07_09300 [Nitrosopumilus sp.]
MNLRLFAHTQINTSVRNQIMKRIKGMSKCHVHEKLQKIHGTHACQNTIKGNLKHKK